MSEVEMVRDLSATSGHLHLEIAVSESERASPTPDSVRARFAAHVLSRLWAARLNDTDARRGRPTLFSLVVPRGF